MKGLFKGSRLAHLDRDFRIKTTSLLIALGNTLSHSNRLLNVKQVNWALDTEVVVVLMVLMMIMSSND